MPRVAKNLAFNVPAREGEAEALNAIARRAGFATWQAMFRHIKDRLVVGVAAAIDPYPEIDRVIKEKIEKAAAAIVASGKQR